VHDGDRDFVWQATFSTEMALLFLKWSADEVIIEPVFVGSIQTVGGANWKTRFTKGTNYHLEGQLRLRSLANEFLEVRAFVKHWSNHWQDRHNPEIDQLNTLGMEQRCWFRGDRSTGEPDSYLFWQAQITFIDDSDSRLSYQRPVALGGYWEHPLVNNGQWYWALWTKQWVELGELSFYSGSVGFKIETPLTMPIDLFAGWTNGRQKMSSLAGETASLDSGISFGVRFYWQTSR